AKWHQYGPVHNDNGLRGAELAFGEKAIAVYDFTRADVVLSLDADFLATGPGHLRYARDFMARRRLPFEEKDASHATMNRLYVIETAVTCTGAKADHRLAVRGSHIESIARAIATELGIDLGGSIVGDYQEWIASLASDLAA